MKTPRRCSNPGFTLVEVLTALALLAMVVIATLSAQSRAQRQSAISAQRLLAVKSLDALLSSWVTADQWPAGLSGPVLDMPGCQWRRSTIPSDLPSSVELVEVQIVEYPPNDQPRVICRAQAFKTKN